MLWQTNLLLCNLVQLYVALIHVLLLFEPCASEMACYSVFHLLNCLDISEEVRVVSLFFPSFFLLFFSSLFSFYSSLPLPFWNGMVMIGVSREVNHTHSFWDTFLTSCNKPPCIFRMFKGIFSCVNESAGIVVLPENIHNVEKLRWDFYTGD